MTDIPEFHVRDVVKLLREIIFPKLFALENELELLKKTTKPLCQAIREQRSLNYKTTDQLSLQLRALIDTDYYMSLM